MPLKDLLGSSHDQPYAVSDPRNPKTTTKPSVTSARPMKLPKAAARPKPMPPESSRRSYYQPPSDAEEGGVASYSAVEAGVRERKILGAISYNDALYFAMIPG